MEAIAWILISTVIVSLLGLVGVFSLWFKKKNLDKKLGFLVAFSAGSLIGGAFFHLLTEAVETSDSLMVFGAALIGFVVFLLIEGFFHSHFCKTCKAHPFTYIMLIGDGVHNFIDGLVIAAAYLTNFGLGVVTSLVIIGHETPQEIGLFGALIYGGHNRKKSLKYSFIAQSTVIIGGIVGYFVATRIDYLVPFLIPFAGGGFIYIAAADLVPEMHKMYGESIIQSAKILLSFALGILLMLGLKVFFG